MCNGCCNALWIKLYTRDVNLRKSIRKGGKSVSDKKSNRKGTFIVKILSSANSTWQGSVTWAEETKTEYFRSALELLKLIDGAINQYDIEGGSHEK